MDNLADTTFGGAAEPSIAALSCLTCKGRKVKCDKKRPSCSNCTRLAQSCAYPAQSMKPGPKPRSTSSVLKSLRKRTSPQKYTTVGQDRAPVSHRHSQHRSPTPTRSVTEKSKLIKPVNGEMKPIRTSTNGDEAMKELNYSSSSPSSTASTVSIFEPYPLSIPGLSWIIHPSDYPSFVPVLDSTPAETYSISTKGGDGAQGGNEEVVLMETCKALHVTPEVMGNMIGTYFDNMTAFSLFHKPSFDDKLYGISTPNHRYALLAAMFAFSARWISWGAETNGTGPQQILTSEEYFNLAMRLLETALEDFPFDEPPIHLLQAMVLTAFHQLIKGVRGKPWRYLGACIRIAYELKLHNIDSVKVKLRGADTEPCGVAQWVSDEERRRVWWTLWEFDIFASSIQESDTAIDATRNVTLLPVDDESWFSQRPTRSCLLELNPTKRWKSLQASGNISAKAWFIVMNSYMRDAQSLSKTPTPFTSDVEIQSRSLSPQTGSGPYNDAHYESDPCKDSAIIANCLRCFSIALPPSLAYKYQYLQFSVNDREHDSEIHAIFLITQLSWFMIYKHDMFSAPQSDALSSFSQANQTSGSHSIISDNGSWRNYLDSVDRILHIINNSSADHIQYLNPFIACTVWIAAAVLLVHKVFSPPSPQTGLNKSKIDLLRFNFNQYLRFWDTSPGLQTKLDTIEKQLDSMRREGLGTSQLCFDKGIKENGVVPGKHTPDGLESPIVQMNIHSNQDKQKAFASDDVKQELMPMDIEGIGADQDSVFISSQPPRQQQYSTMPLINKDIGWQDGYDNVAFNGIETGIPTTDILGDFTTGTAGKENIDLQHYLNNILGVSLMDTQTSRSFATL